MKEQHWEVSKLGTMQDYLASVEEVILAYLFGSRVNGVVGPLSDCDLGVVVRSPSPELRYHLSHGLGRVLDTERIDLVFLNEAPVEMAYAIVSQGQLLYECDLATRIEFEARVLSCYGDYLPVLRHQRQDILEGRRYEAGVRRYREALGRTERALAALKPTQGEEPV